MSLKVLGWTAAVCEMTALVAASTFKTALQQGQVTSKMGGFFAIGKNDTPNSDRRGGLAGWVRLGQRRRSGKTLNK
jgi:hypothetical protein